MPGRPVRRLSVASGFWAASRDAGRGRCSDASGLPEAADELEAGGLGTDVVVLASAGLTFRSIQAMKGLGSPAGAHRDPRARTVLDSIFPAEQAIPDRHRSGRPSAPARLSRNVRKDPGTCLVVGDFGQSGTPAEETSRGPTFFPRLTRTQASIAGFVWVVQFFALDPSLSTPLHWQAP